jgi:hypothetical protein
LAKRAKKAKKKAATPVQSRVVKSAVPTPVEPLRRPTLASTAIPLLALLIVLLSALTMGFVWNEDLWWYLASGDTILEQGSIPEHDMFLYTSNENTRFPSHSWLWSVVLVLWERMFGLSGVVMFGALVAGAVVVLVFCSARVDRFGLVNGLFVAFVMVSAAERLSLKSELATWLFLVVFFYFLDRDVPFTWRTLLLLAALQWLWSNFHAGYPLGLAIALAYSVGGWLQGFLEKRRGRNSQASPPPLWTVPVLFVATLLTPEVSERLRIFYAGADITASRLAGKGLTVAIDELQGTFAVEDSTFRTLYLIALMVGGLCWWVSPAGPRRISRLFFLGGMAVLGYSAIRHVTALVLTAALVGLICLAERRAQKRSTEEAPKPLYLAATVLFALGLVLSTVGMFSLRKDLEAGQSADSFYTISPLASCPGAADFIERNHLQGPIFNDLILGGYLTWRLYPEHRLFIDNRAIRRGLNKEYVELSTSRAAWKKAEKKYGFRTAVLSNLAVPNHIPLRSFLTADPGWQMVYVDPMAVVFVKQGVATRRDIQVAGQGVQAVPFLTAESGLRTLPRRAAGLFFRTEPGALLHQYLSVVGRLKLNSEMDQLATLALEKRPRDARLYRDRGSARALLGRAEEGVEDLEEAVRLAPEDAWNHFTYALALRDNGQPVEALESVERAHRMEPGNARFESLRRRLAAGLGR